MLLETQKTTVHEYAALTRVESVAIRNLCELIATGDHSIEALEQCKLLREMQVRKKYLLDQLKRHDLPAAVTSGPEIVSGSA